MHTFDAVWKFGNPTPHREDKKLRRKNREEKREKMHPKGLEGTFYPNFGIF